MDDERTPDQRVVPQLREFAAAGDELGRLFARTKRMHTTDAAAMVAILTAEDQGAPMTPARLAEHVVLTTGATSTLLNRLEDAGHIIRTRGHSDRRVVTLHSTPAIHASADAFFAGLAQRQNAVLAGYTDAELSLVETVVDRLTGVVKDFVEHPPTDD
ncbi:MarR family winged helix-turn-helix transcriptional regulator [Amycolatopsis sp. WQ 127309]|uniref:MarR family winged helix-turn-helix transcriptional regulator n=1 Tax=Amycolatopsis sp. WQ 127309 TaxID=2932773 RepID=UPI001FF5E95B|nr:MarR family transcriptional regulator [Amycolatopsis sp. WQ 127309]UOZ05517.1 MarR family transcriptional regulator [Amycolatopsis sp. WQ 127309]